MSTHESNCFGDDNEVEAWEIEWAKEAIAPYLDENGKIDFDKLHAACVPLDEMMQKEWDAVLSGFTGHFTEDDD